MTHERQLVKSGAGLITEHFAPILDAYRQRIGVATVEEAMAICNRRLMASW